MNKDDVSLCRRSIKKCDVFQIGILRWIRGKTESDILVVRIGSWLCENSAKSGFVVEIAQSVEIRDRQVTGIIGF